MQAEVAASIGFLKWFRKAGPWVLTSIVPDGRITTTTFTRDQEKLLQEWLTSRAGVENIYFQVNTTIHKHITKKTNKSEIIAAEWLHVDIDPSVSDSDLWDAERKRILTRIEQYGVRPTLVIDSGGGYQAFWRLDKPVTVSTPSDEAWADFERYNRQLEIDLGGDHCHNVDRIMRLPGTINVPNKKKAAKGRTPVLAKIVLQRDETTELKLFSQAPLLDGGEQGDIGRPKVQLSGNLPRLSDVDELGDIPQNIKMLIVQGHDPDNPEKYPSRSECFWFVVCELVRQEIPDDMIASVILDPDFLISAHVLDQKNPEGYAVRQIQRAKEFAINSALPSMNDFHFTTIIGGKFKIGVEWDDGEIEFWSKETLLDHYSNEKVQIGVTKDGAPVTMPKGKWWLQQPERRSYKRGIIFEPAGETQEGVYNLWRGFSYVATAGDLHKRFLDHLFENICSSVQHHYDYLIKWCARLIQNPASQSETAIVLRGEEGTGKNTFVGTLGALFGRHYFEAASAQRIMGNFNSHLRDKALVHANEAFFAGDRRHEASLKNLITEPVIAIEAKGVDITMQPNYVHLIMSSNDEWVVPAGPFSRRFFVLDVGDQRRQDNAYFAAIKSDLQKGGYSHFLRHLLDMDLSDFNVYDTPITTALIDQRIHTMPKIAQWWMSRLDQGYIINQEDGWISEVEVEHVWQSYVKDMQEQAENYRSTKIELGQFLKKTCPGIEKRRLQNGNSRRNYYKMPDLDTARKSFDEIMGGPYRWSSMEADIQDTIPF